LATAVAIFAFPSVASAEYLVPPGNSAVDQYTESVPTSGGPRDINKGRKGGRPSPDEVLGKDNTRRLESQGSEGRKAAEVIAATAPDTDVASAPGNGEEAGRVVGGSGGGGGGESGAPGGRIDQAGAGEHGQGTGVEEPGGSSGLGEVLGQATGSSSGQMGLLLPLAILATAAWALAFFWRQRDRRTS
jgi:hypothetical protein